MDELEWSHLDEIRLEPTAEILRVEYSEPDQGGTRLVHRFLLPTSLGALAGHVLLREDGYAHDSSWSRGVVAWEALPRRVGRDAVEWMRNQLSNARRPEDRDLANLLSTTLASFERLAV